MAKAYGKKKNKLEQVARFIVEKRKAIYLIYILLAIFCFFSAGWVSVNNTLTDYLAEDTETSRGLAVMEEEFITYATAEVMVDNISYGDAELLCGSLEEIEGVKEIAFDDTTKHYADGAALFSVTFSGEDDDPLCETALANIRTAVEDYDSYLSAELGNTKAETIAEEMNLVMVLACVIILSVLLFTSRTYMEIPVQILTFGMAAILNKGTNFIFGEISFVSDSIAIVLQLALAIDYAIILCHRYMEERETSEPMEATVTALCKAIPEISGSCMTTLSGLAAMAFMHFEIGRDMSMVLIKAIILSILSVFTLMPGLLYSFSGKIDSTHHKNFVPKITPWTNLVVKLRHVTPIVFAVLLVASFLISKDCPYVYSYTHLNTFTKNESQIAKDKISDTFTASNVLAVLIPSGDYEKEQALTRDLELLPE
ncbi:MAG: MMPL family transporter, partial [Anaerotignum sp.]